MCRRRLILNMNRPELFVAVSQDSTMTLSSVGDDFDSSGVICMVLDSEPLSSSVGGGATVVRKQTGFG